MGLVPTARSEPRTKSAEIQFLTIPLCEHVSYKVKVSLNPTVRSSKFNVCHRLQTSTETARMVSLCHESEALNQTMR